MNKRQLGSCYETVACRYLEQRGMRILERNFRCRQGEIDIIARDVSRNILVFCEVKYRKNHACGDPLEAVDSRKQRQISRTAMVYYAYHGYAQDVPCRFDVVAIGGDGDITYLEDAFLFVEG